MRFLMASAKTKTKTPTYWVGFDLGGTKMLGLVYDGDFNVLARIRIKSRGYEGEAAGLKRIVEVIEEALAKAGVSVHELSGIGIGCPGPLDLKGGVLLEAPNLGWANVPLRDELEKQFGAPVRVCNDVDAGTFGEYRFGAGAGADTVLGIFPGTGIGGGCVIDGRLVEGGRYTCMEIGHMTVMGDGPICGCGKRGCLEAVASRLAIAAAASAAACRGEAPALFEEAGTDIREIRSGTLARSIAGGDDAVARIVRRAARWVGRVAGNLVNVLGANRIVLGGGLVEALPDLYAKEVREGMQEELMPAMKIKPKVMIAVLGDDATAMGAAAWVEHATARRMARTARSHGRQ